MLDFYLEPNTLSGAVPGSYRAVVTQQEGAQGDAFLKMVSTTLNMSLGEATGILKGVAQAALALTGQGWTWTLPGIGTITFSIQGNFDGPDAVFDPAIHRIVVHFRPDRSLTAAAQTAPKNRLHGVVHGPVIDAVVDMTTNATNSTLTPGGNIKLSGKDFKIVGNAPNNGIAFLDADGEPIQVAPSAISRNSPTELIFICPNLAAGTYTVKVTTQYSGSKHTLDTPRSYTFEQVLTVG
jgi:hypothetical protein